MCVFVLISNVRAISCGSRSNQSSIDNVALLDGVSGPRELQPQDFHDNKAIYQFRSFFQLVQATFVFQLCKFNVIVDNSLRVSLF